MLDLFSLTLPLLLWAILRVTMKPGPYEMDFDANVRGTFISLLPWYSRFYWVIAGVGLVGFVWDASTGGIRAGLFLFLAAIYAFLFNGLLLFFYESYLHARYPRSGAASKSRYTLGRYALILSLGFSAVVVFLLGMLFSAWRMI